MKNKRGPKQYQVPFRSHFLPHKRVNCEVLNLFKIGKFQIQKCSEPLECFANKFMTTIINLESWGQQILLIFGTTVAPKKSFLTILHVTSA